MKNAPARICRERVHRGQHPGSNKEGSDQGQREREDGHERRPVLETAALFGDRQRVNQGGTHQPGHEGGVLDRIPEPPASPPQFVIGPGTSQGDAYRQEEPGCRGPGARPAGPSGVEVAADQCRDGEGKGHGEADISHVEHGRMRHHARILKQGIEVSAIRRCRPHPVEGIGREEHEKQESHADPSHDGKDACQHGQRESLAELRNRQHPHAQHEHPKKQRALVTAPKASDAVRQGQCGVRIARHIGDREVVADERPRKAARGRSDQQGQHAGGRTRHGHSFWPSALCAPHRHHAEDQGDAQGDPEQKVSQFSHYLPPDDGFIVPPLRALVRASAASGGM